MFHLVFQACLAASPAQCGPILLPAADSSHAATCAEGAEDRMRAWLAERPELTGSGPECRSGADLPALPLRQVAPGVLVSPGAIGQMEDVADGHVANLGVIIGADAVAVVDAGVSRAQGQALHVAIRRITDLPIRHLVLTHMHPDHSLGAEVMAEAGATIHAHHALADSLAARAEGYLATLERLYPVPDWIGTRALRPDAPVRDAAVIALGDRDLHLQAWPAAHTDNDLTLWDPASGTFFAGDLVFRELTPVVDGALTGWLDWMAVDRAPQARLIVPGHGAAARTWAEATGPQQDLLKALAQAARAAIAEGLSLSEAIPAIVAAVEPLREGWTAFDQTMARNATVAYTELEWE